MRIPYSNVTDTQTATRPHSSHSNSRPNALRRAAKTSHVLVTSSRPCVGVEIRDGPVLISGSVFRKFAPTLERNAYAIGFYPNNSGQSSPLNTVASNSFDSTVILSFYISAFVRCCSFKSKSFFNVSYFSQATWTRRAVLIFPDLLSDTEKW